MRFLGTRPSEGRAFEAESTASAEALRRGTLRVWEEPLGGQREQREMERGGEGEVQAQRGGCIPQMLGGRRKDATFNVI